MDDFKSLPPQEQEFAGSIPSSDEEDLVERYRNMGYQSEFQRSEREKNVQSQGTISVMRHLSKIAVMMVWIVAIIVALALIASVVGAGLVFIQIFTPLDPIPHDQMENAKDFALAVASFVVGTLTTAVAGRLIKFVRWRE